ncbi:hypothetical protein KEM54_005876 [Ascosphaera aggregata]|nr:hypothetical protein KEM54_005876 [Ascosphaera aggregata]
MSGRNPWSEGEEVPSGGDRPRAGRGSLGIEFSFGDDERALFAEQPLEDELLRGSVFKNSPNQSYSSPFDSLQDSGDTGVSQESAEIGAFPSNRQAEEQRRQWTVKQNRQGALNQAGGNHQSGTYSPTSTSNTDATLDYHIAGPGCRVGYSDFSSIDWIFEHAKERGRVASLHESYIGPFGRLRLLLDSTHVWLVLICSGVAVGVLAACIDIAGDWLGDLKTGYCKAGPEGGHLSKCTQWVQWREAFQLSKAWGYVVEYLFYIFYSILFASTASFLALTYACYAKHSGIPEIKSILNGLVIQQFLSPKTLLIKSLGLCLAVASGLWLGKEGPLIHVACCCADLFMRPFKSLYRNEATRREILAAAAASGISVAFGSPIGGVLFTLEQVASYFPDKTMWRSFVCAMVAGVALHAMNPFRTGKIVLYQVTYTRGWHSFEIFPFIMLGILGGLYGAFLIKLNMKFARWKRSQDFQWPVLVVALVALVTAIVNFPNIFMRAQLSDLVHYLFSQCSDSPDDPFLLCKTGAASWATISLLLTAAFFGFCFATITFGLDIPAGIILPSLAIGALYGRAVGIAMEMWQRAHPNYFLFDACGEPESQCITPGIYAIIGAAAALGGASRMTVSIVVIMFELTGALTYVIPIMISVMLSRWCGDIFGKKSIYESWIHFKGYTFLDHEEDSSILDLTVRSVMKKLSDLTVITAEGHTIETLRDILAETTYRGFPIIKELSNPVLLGYISRNELAFALDSATKSSSAPLPKETPAYFVTRPFLDPNESDFLDLRPWMDHTPMTMTIFTSSPIVLQMFQRLGVRYILLVNSGLLEGLLTKKDMWHIMEDLGGYADEVNGTGCSGGLAWNEDDAGNNAENENLLAREAEVARAAPP